MGGLLKQLFTALGRYIWYHTTRIFHLRKPTETPAMANAPRAEALSNDVGLDPDDF